MSKKTKPWVWFQAKGVQLRLDFRLNELGVEVALESDDERISALVECCELLHEKLLRLVPATVETATLGIKIATLKAQAEALADERRPKPRHLKVVR